MANALKKITTRAKQLRKKNPGKSWKTVVKQAGAEYRSGKLKKRRSSPKKKVARKRRKSPRRVAAVGKVRRVTPRRKRSTKRRAAAKPKIRIRTRTVTKTVRVGRRVSGSGKLLPVLAIAAVAVGAYLLLKRPAPVLVQSTNPQRNNLATDILGYAAAAGMTATAIAKLIETINNSNDSQVQKIYDNVRTGQQPYANIAGCISYN